MASCQCGTAQAKPWPGFYPAAFLLPVQLQPKWWEHCDNSGTATIIQMATRSLLLLACLPRPSFPSEEKAAAVSAAPAIAAANAADAACSRTPGTGKATAVKLAGDTRAARIWCVCTGSGGGEKESMGFSSGSLPHGPPTGLEVPGAARSRRERLEAALEPTGIGALACSTSGGDRWASGKMKPDKAPSRRDLYVLGCEGASAIPARRPFRSGRAGTRRVSRLQ